MFSRARRASFPAPALIGLLACSVFAAAQQQTPKFPTNEDLRHTRSMSQPRLSPDGRQVLVQISDATADGGSSHLWLVDIEHNRARQLTFAPGQADKADKTGKGGESAGEWMPDGESILFTAHRGEHTLLYRLPMNGGEAQAFDLKIAPPVDESKAPNAIPPPDAKTTSDKTATEKASTDKKPADPVALDISSFAIAPDGKTIAVIARDPETPGEKKQKDDKADAVWTNHEQHRERAYLFHLQLPDAAGKAPAVQLTPVAIDADAHEALWSHKSDSLIVLAEAPNGADDLGPAGSAWLVAPGDPAHPSRLENIPATIESGAWSRDDADFYFLAQAKADAPPGYRDLFAVHLKDGAARNLSDGFSGSLSGDIISASGSEGEGMLVATETGTRAGFARVSAVKSDIAAVNLPGTVVANLSTNTKQTGWVYLRTSSTEPTTLCYTEKLNGTPKILAAPALMPGNWAVVETKLVSWKSDGRSIEGLLSLPPQAAGSKVPLIVDVHGGPLGAWTDTYSPMAEFLLGHGWAVLRPNPRGSTGRGADFAAANKNDLGGGDYRDIMAGVDAVLRDYPIDSGKLALMGYSYGGEMAGFVEGKTDRFRAIISGAPVIDQFSEYGTEGGSWYDRWYFGKPWEHMDDAWRQSPLSGAAHAKTPFLLLQGQGDTTDPLGQSQEMYRALRQAGVSVEMVEYPRENHGPLARGMMGGPVPEPWHGFDARQRLVEFLEKAFAGQAQAK